MLKTESRWVLCHTWYWRCWKSFTFVGQTSRCKWTETVCVVDIKRYFTHSLTLYTFGCREYGHGLRSTRCFNPVQRLWCKKHFENIWQQGEIYAGIHSASTFYHQTTAKMYCNLESAKSPDSNTHTYRDGLHVALHVCLNVAKPFALLDRHIVVGRRRRCRQCRTDCLCACFAFNKFHFACPENCYTPYTRSLYHTQNSPATHIHNQTTTLRMLMLELQFRCASSVPCRKPVNKHC